MTSRFFWSESGKCETLAIAAASVCLRALICFQQRKKMEPADFSAASGHKTLGAYVCQIPLFTLSSISALPCSRVFSKMFTCFVSLHFISLTGTTPLIFLDELRLTCTVLTLKFRESLSEHDISLLSSSRL